MEFLIKSLLSDVSVLASINALLASLLLLSINFICIIISLNVLKNWFIAEFKLPIVSFEITGNSFVRFLLLSQKSFKKVTGAFNLSFNILEIVIDMEIPITRIRNENIKKNILMLLSEFPYQL